MRTRDASGRTDTDDDPERRPRLRQKAIACLRRSPLESGSGLDEYPSMVDLIPEGHISLTAAFDLFHDLLWNGGAGGDRD